MSPRNGGTSVDNEILELIDLISKSNFVEFELEREGFKIKLVKAAGRTAAAPPPAAPVLAVADVPATSSPGASPVAPVPPTQRFHEIKSPLVGTFFRSPSPEAPAFTEVGRAVRAGQVLCIVEAMKLMNEIESEVAGHVTAAFVENGQPVEFGEKLFAIKQG